jgi:hypothetical protein
LHVCPFGDERLEVIVQSKFGYGNTVYQGANRYYLNNFLCSNIKLNSKEKLLLEGYTTTEDGGQSYDMLFTGININRKWKMIANGLQIMVLHFANLLWEVYQQMHTCR